MRRALLVLFVWACCLTPAGAAVRIKDVTSLRGARDAQLTGYGLVIGLQGTGDSLRNAPFTDQSLQSMLDRMGLNMRGASLRNKNVAAVLVTADLSLGVDAGQRLDVTVSSLGDATSLMGGTLILTQLADPNGQTRASSQGALTVTGFDAAGQAENVTQGVPTAGRIPNGAIVETPIEGPVDELRMFLELRNPDYQTAMRIIDTINDFSKKTYRRAIAFERDARSVELFRPKDVTTPRLMSQIGELLVEPDTAARVVVDARTGTVVIGQDVQISTVAVTHGTLNVHITEQRQNGGGAAHASRCQRSRRPGRRGQRIEPARAGDGPQSARRQAQRHHRNSAGDQIGRRAAGRSRGAIASGRDKPSRLAFAS